MDKIGQLCKMQPATTYRETVCERCSLTLVFLKKGKKTIPSKHSRQYLWNIVGNILKDIFEKGS